MKAFLAVLLSLTFSGAALAQDKGRDWTQVDTNKDGYISPEEMAAWLKKNPGPAVGK